MCKTALTHRPSVRWSLVDDEAAGDKRLAKANEQLEG